jgi:hypothetical protein
MFLNFCDTGDRNKKDRAAALYLYMLLRNELPQNFDEATNTVPHPTAPATVFGGLKLPARKAFANVNLVDLNQPVFAGAKLDASGNPTGGRRLGSTVGPELEAAVLLYLILAEKSLEGTTFQADDATQGAQADLLFMKKAAFASGTDKTISFRVFVDPWGTPITFTRFTVGGLGFTGPATTGELNNSPYIEAGNNRDPLDPKDLLKGWTNTINKGNALMGLHATIYDGGFKPKHNAANDLFDGMNRQPSVHSAGPNRNTGTTPGEVWSSGHADAIFGGDNISGYRLRREGARGD